MKAQRLVAWNLRRLRVAQSRSQEDLALEAEVDRSYMSRLERGRVRPDGEVRLQSKAAAVFLACLLLAVLAPPSFYPQVPGP